MSITVVLPTAFLGLGAPGTSELGSAGLALQWPCHRRKCWGDRGLSLSQLLGRQVSEVLSLFSFTELGLEEDTLAEGAGIIVCF